MSKKIVERINELENDILKSVQNANCITELLTFMDSDKYSSSIILSAMHSLRRVFTKILDENYLREKKLQVSAEVAKALEQYRSWLNSQYKGFLNGLLSLLLNSDVTIQVGSLRTLMFFVMKGGYDNKDKIQYIFNTTLYADILKVILSCDIIPEQIKLTFEEDYLIYNDICLNTYKCLQVILKHAFDLKQKSKSISTMNKTSLYTPLLMMEFTDLIKHVLMFIALISMKERIATTETSNYIQGTKQVPITDLKKAFSSFWIYLMQLPLNESLYIYILISLPESVLCYMSNPLLLTDYLKDSFKLGGYISVLSLYSLFILMTQYNLQYPEYYKHLYELTTLETFSIKHRSKFLELIIVSLRSSHIPEYIVISFIKKLCRISIQSTPSTCLFIASILPELFAYHPYLSYLIDQEYRASVTEVLAIRKPLPYIDAEEMKKIQEKENEREMQVLKEEHIVIADAQEEDTDDDNSNNEEETNNKKKDDLLMEDKEFKEYKKQSKTVTFEDKKEETKDTKDLVNTNITGDMSTLDIILKAKELAKLRIQKQQTNNTDKNEDEFKKDEINSTVINTNKTSSTKNIIDNLKRNDSDSNEKNSNSNKRIMNVNENNNKRKITHEYEDIYDFVNNYDSIDHYQSIHREMKPLTSQMTQLYEIFALLNHYNPEVAQLAHQLTQKTNRSRTNYTLFTQRTYKTEFDKYFKQTTDVPHEFIKHNGVFKENNITSELYSLDI